MPETFSFDPNLTPDEIIRAIDRWATETALHQAVRLWHILTALRGPDSGNCDVKFKTTAIIRSYSFPKLAGLVWAFTNPEGDLGSLRDAVNLFLDQESSHHFLGHIASAATHLIALQEERKIRVQGYAALAEKGQ